jgi:hypothetical protein
MPPLASVPPVPVPPLLVPPLLPPLPALVPPLAIVPALAPELPPVELPPLPLPPIGCSKKLEPDSVHALASTSGADATTAAMTLRRGLLKRGTMD